MARQSKPSPDLIPEETEYSEELLPAPGANENSASEINLKVQHVQEQLLDLKRQQEDVERQKRELEELSRKQREFDEGRREIVEKLTRGLVLLERQELETKRELDQIKIVRDSFAEHLGQTENLNPAEWASEELPNELTRGLARVDQAKVIFNQSRARLAALRHGEEGEGDILPSDLPSSYAPAEQKSFGAMVHDGFAYTLPLLVVLSAIGVVLLLIHH